MVRSKVCSPGVSRIVFIEWLHQFAPSATYGRRETTHAREQLDKLPWLFRLRVDIKHGFLLHSICCLVWSLLRQEERRAASHGSGREAGQPDVSTMSEHAGRRCLRLV